MLAIPKNVMQIGEINPYTKIYMEDYVHTFLERRKGKETYLAFGKKEDIGNVSYYMIYGVEKKTDWDRGSYPYFKKYERIGMIEEVNGGRVFKPVRGSGILLDGYFIFYEQNEDMQSYMIAVRETEAEAGTEEKEEVLEAVMARREQHKKETEQINGTPRHRRTAEGTSAAAPEKPHAPRVKENPVRMGRKIMRSSTAGKTPVFAGRRKPEKRVEHRISKPSGNKRMTGAKHTWTIPDLCRAGSLMLLLVLVVTGLTSLNHYPDMKSITQLFSNAANAVRKDRAVEADAQPQENGALIVEEATAVEMENVEAAEAAPDDFKEEALTLATDDAQIQWTIGQTPASQMTEEVAQQPEPSEAPETNEQTAAAETESEQEATQAIARPVTYVVKRGDSLAGIARKFYGNTSKVKEICSLNKIKDPDQIHPGQNILLP